MDGAEGWGRIVKKLTRKQHIRLLLAAVAALVMLILIVTFTNDVNIPTWSQIFGGGSVSQDDDFVRFIDVGQGDSVLISSNGYNAMIDFGDNTDDGAELMMDLRRYGIKHIDCMIITHYDSDHIGGADTVIERLNVENIILPIRYEEASKSLAEVDEAIKGSDANVYIAKVGTVINIGEFELTVVAHYIDEADTNERSIIIMAEIDGLKFLFTGDADSSIEKRLIEDGLLLDCDVFKAGHHGSKYSNSLKFLEYITPSYAVISCGELNSYGHPHNEVIKNFNTVNAKTSRTDTDGDITFYIKNGALLPTAEFVR